MGCRKVRKNLDTTPAEAEPRDVECDFTYTGDDEGNWTAAESAEAELTSALLS